jgi:UbiA prenyltransferase family
LRYSRGIQRNLIGLIRADQWWEYKLVPILSTFYATALVLHVALSSVWVGVLSLLVAIVAAAIYASVLNDLTDLPADLEAGKRNGVAGRSRAMVATLVALAVGAGVFFAGVWRDDAPLFSCYLATWLAFSLYSLPPLRLKARGAAGLLCDAAGEQLLPSLVAVFLAGRDAHRAVSGAWAASVAVWALSYGLRGIVWHQLTDVDNDRAAGVWSFARRHPRAAPVIGTFVVFPLEIGALAAMLWQIGSAWPPAFLVLYLLYAARSARRWQTSPVIVVPKPQCFIVLHQFYTDLFPVALLIAASVRDRRALIVLAAHLLLFPRRVVHAIRRLSASIARTVVRASEPHHGGVG